MASPAGRAWLDLQRYVVTAAENLGYTAVASAIKAELAALLQSYPDLKISSLMDDTPCANNETIEWLGGFAEASAASAAPMPVWEPRYEESEQAGNTTEEGEKLLEWPKMVYQFHREGFDLPSGATLLARGEAYENQALRVGENAWGIQFHGELTRVMMHRWVVRGAHRFELPGAQTGDKHLAGRFLHDAPLRNWMLGMLDMVFRPREI